MATVVGQDVGAEQLLIKSTPQALVSSLYSSQDMIRHKEIKKKKRKIFFQARGRNAHTQSLKFGAGNAYLEG
jgi:hypothetical protein